MHRNKLGATGEEVAEKYVKSLGYKVLVKNWYSGKWGEIDLIAKDCEIFVFIEVKSRSSKIFGMPEDSITNFKKAAFLRACKYYVLINKLDASYRLDMISVRVEYGKTTLNHFKNFMP